MYRHRSAQMDVPQLRVVHTVTHGELTLQLLRRVGGGAFGSVWEASLVSAPADGPPLGRYAVKRVNFAKYAGQSVKERVANREFTLPPRVDYPFLCRHYASWVRMLAQVDGLAGANLRRVNTARWRHWMAADGVCAWTHAAGSDPSRAPARRRPRAMGRQAALCALAQSISAACADQRACLAVNAVGVLHMELDLLHRDIKPSNIMITNEHDYIKLVDYGFVAPNDTATTTLGTPAYMAPEIRSGKYGTKADIYAIGMTLVHAAIGYVPQASTAEAMAELVREALAGHSSVLQDFILQLVEPREHLRTIISLALKHPFLESEERAVPWFLRAFSHSFRTRTADRHRRPTGR